jgi:hypothetical protein
LKFFLTTVIIQIKVSAFAAFATNGNPNNPTLKNVRWEKIENDLPPWNCLDISDDTKFITLPETSNMEIWDQMYAETDSDLI